jgi:Ran GTPase-activating protein (RanGAP) involved in mRNA processing and transport
MPPDPKAEWVGPIPTDPLELCMEYKLGFDDPSDLQAKSCIMTYDERKQLDVDDAKVLGQALIDQGPCDVEYLFLSGNTFGDEGCFAIAKAIEADMLPKLLTIDLSRNSATDAGFAAIVNAIKFCPRFRDLIFQENELGDTGFAALHEVLKRDEWPNIERLNLAGVQFARHTISDASFVPFANDLADGVIKCLRLEELEMSDNDIQDSGFAAFAVAIQRGNVRKLKSLYFVSNLITDDGANALAGAIANNKRTKLFDIRLGFQNISDPAGPRVTKEGGKAAITAAGATLGRKVECILAPLADGAP